MRAFLLSLLLLLSGPAWAQDFGALARLDAAQSAVRDTRGGGLRVDLWLSQAVPWRVFTLDDPRRLVLDFREVDWRGAGPSLIRGARATDLRAGRLRPGWSRLVVDLGAPMPLHSAEMQVDEVTGTAHLVVVLRAGDDAGFAASSGAPDDPGWAKLSDYDLIPPPRPSDDVLVVALDPGHGGIDPGALRDGVSEAPIMLAMAREIRAELRRRDGFQVVLTRDEDVFVPLADRMSRARAAGAEVLISLHADALELDQAAGASVYVLSKDGQQGASARMAERHERADLLAGVDLAGQDDQLAMALMDLVRQDTKPASLALQAALIRGFAGAEARLNSNPDRSARLAVLMAADFPSVLIEAGFLSNPADRLALSTSAGRAPVVAGIVAGLTAWRDEQAAKAPLKRR